MAKHIKFYSGHTVKEWETKYKKQIAKGKIKVFNNEKDLIDFAYYWKIDNKFYQVPNIFEWYNKSLRKSVGLTVALTGTSILATFFLCAALIQSQVKWNEDQGYSISFYAGDGEFSGGAKSKVVNGIKKGTKLSKIKNYSSCIPSLDDYSFKHWFVDDGTETIRVDDETKITSNLSLKPYFELNPKDPVNFATDSWETVLSVIRQGKDKFINTYCKDQPTFATDKEQALLDFMDSKTNWRTISVGGVSDYGVRIIGIGQDILDKSEKPLDRELFTFEFNECVTSLPYLYTQAGAPFYTQSGSEDPDEPNEYCGLKTFTEDIVYNQLPLLIRENIKTVTKRTLQVRKGFKYGYNEPLQSWDFYRGCLNGTACPDPETGGEVTDPDNKIEMVTTSERLFSLSLDEIGATEYEFDYILDVDPETGDPTVTADGLPLMKETTQTTSNEIVDGDGKPILDTIGEGFEDKEKPGNYTKAYQFYTHEWYNPDDHTDNVKRMKRYFIGVGNKSINSAYHLRSIYIPSKYDTYNPESPDLQHTSGNKDYCPFETWNIAADGSIGNYKTSGLPDESNPGVRKHFAAGDMAWVSAFVAPAFCL